MFLSTKERPILTSAAAGRATLLAALLWPVATSAVQQPDGQIIPIILSPGAGCTTGLNVQACLDDSEVSLGGTAGAVGAIANATINQETFDPGWKKYPGRNLPSTRGLRAPSGAGSTGSSPDSSRRSASPAGPATAACDIRSFTVFARTSPLRR